MTQWVKTLTAQDLYLNLTPRTQVNQVKENRLHHLSSVHRMNTEALVPPLPVISNPSFKKHDRNLLQGISLVKIIFAICILRQMSLLIFTCIIEYWLIIGDYRAPRMFFSSVVFWFCYGPY